MAGRAASHFGVKPIIPAVAISKGDDLTCRWTVVSLPEEVLREEEKPHTSPETTVWIEGSSVVALDPQQKPTTFRV